MRTHKPCPGCKKVVSSRPADSVCDECARAIANWREHVSRVNADKELETVRLKRAWHWYPGFYFGGPHVHIDGLSETREELGRLFWELGELSCKERFEWKDAPDRPGEKDWPYLFVRPDVRRPPTETFRNGQPVEYPASEGSSCYHSLYGRLDKRLLEVIRLLWDHTARFAEMAYLGGLQDGRNLLMQLASGQLSTDDLQKRDLAVAKDVQNANYLHRKLKRRRS